jgi:aspartate aminotransferase-like enzyme
MKMNLVKNRPYRLMTPGPVPLSPQVREILAQPMIHHRTPEFEKVLKSVGLKLKKTFLTAESVYMHASTGSGAMESSIVNTLNPGDKILTLVSGKFGERWRDMARRHGCEIIEISIPWGEAAKPADVQNILEKNSDIKAVLCQACETSTATSHPIQEIAQIVRKYPDTLFIVDAITGIAAMPLKMDEWGLDVVVSGSQKAFMLPTGLSFISMSKKAWAANARVKNPGFYFDLRSEKKSIDKGETHFSSVVPLVRALDVVLDDLNDESLNKTIARSEKLADVTRLAGEKLGFKVFSKSPSSSVTALLTPPSVDGAKIRDRLESDYNITVMGGQDQLKGKVIRIGHLGYITDEDMIATFECLALTLKDLGDASITDEKVNAIANFVKSELSKP